MSKAKDRKAQGARSQGKETDSGKTREDSSEKFKIKKCKQSQRSIAEGGGTAPPWFFCPLSHLLRESFLRNNGFPAFYEVTARKKPEKRQTPFPLEEGFVIIKGGTFGKWRSIWPKQEVFRRHPIGPRKKEGGLN
jgi:hypothetical protein